MPWQLRLPGLLHHPVGVSLVNGQGVSGILCGFDNRNIYLLEYLYHSQFATKHYSIGQIHDITPFPSCNPSPFGPLY
ncbi:MAG: LSm family protein [Thermincolia bacterium]